MGTNYGAISTHAIHLPEPPPQTHTYIMHTVIDDCLEHLWFAREVSEPVFSSFTRANPALLFPAFQLQVEVSRHGY